jgi:hypothetical protein
MTLHIINLKHRTDRLEEVLIELESQGAKNYVLWEGVYDTEKPSIGIAKAHQQIILWASEQNIPEVLIAEDDLQFTGKGALDYYLKSEPQDYDLYLGGISYGKLNNDDIVEEFTGTHLYKIRQRFYSTLLSLSGEVDIDRALARKGKYYVCNPMVAIQRNAFSDNKKEYRNNSIYFKNRKLWNPG